MTEWNALEYMQRSGLQMAMAKEVLALLSFEGSEHILDVGCGDGRTTAEIAARVPRGTVVGIDPSHGMIDFARSRFGPSTVPNLRFEVGDARRLSFQQEFDLVVSFNALHWIPQQEEALRSIHAALKPNAAAQLRLVPRGKRKSLENVIEETRLSLGWNHFFQGFHNPYLHLTPEQYSELAKQNGFRVDRVHTEAKAWDFETRAAFLAFSTATMVEWTRLLPDSEKAAFITDVLDRYQPVAADKPGEENTFKFYQMDVRLIRESA